METMLDALEAASPGAKRTRRVSKTALARLRVDQLRGLLETLGSDPRGSKDVLVGRLLDIAGSEEAAAQREQRERRAAAAGGADAAPREG